MLQRLAFAMTALQSALTLGAATFPLKYTALLNASIDAIAVDAGGSAYITGSAYNVLPTSAGAFQTGYAAASCYIARHTEPCPMAYAAKLTPDGTAISYLTYLGMANSSGSGISVDAHGSAWITGTVSSSDLPVTPDAFQRSPMGPPNAFALKLNATGSRVLYATYLGGTDSTAPSYPFQVSRSLSQTMDSAGHIYIAGLVSAAQFPVTSGAYQTDNGGARMTSFVASFDSAGKVVYSTYFHGGSGSYTAITSIATDVAGNVYVTGTHEGGSLQTTAGAFQTSAGTGLYGAFAAKLDSTGSQLLYSTYLAADSPVSGTAIAVDSQGSAYVTGNITLTAAPSNFPVTPGAFQTLPPVLPIQLVSLSSFVAKLNPTGTGLVYSTLLGPSGDTWTSGLTVDSGGSAIISGYSVAADFPTTPGGLRQCKSDSGDDGGFVLKLSADGLHPVYSTYLGGNTPNTLVVDASGQIYVGGDGIGSAPPPMIPGSVGWNSGSSSFAIALMPEALPAGSINCVRNVASLIATSVAPGEIVDIFGNGIGPQDSVSSSAVSGQIPTSLGGVQVLFGNQPAPLLFAGPNQIRAVVPYELAPAILDFNGQSNVQILNSGTGSEPFGVNVSSLAPAIFTANGVGEGLALMVNQDGTLNSQANPAAPGTIVTFYVTGMNNTNPPLTTGAIPAGAASLAVAGQLKVAAGQGEVTYAGAAPGFVGGLTQVNLRLPASGHHGQIGLALSVSDSIGTPGGVYFFVR